MKRIKVKVGDGWQWLWGRSMPARGMVTTPRKSSALPSTHLWGRHDLAWAKACWPDQEFKLSEKLEEPPCTAT